MMNLPLNWTARAPRECSCPSCGAAGEKAFVVSSGWLELFECPECGSKFFPDLRRPEYEQSDEPEAFLRFYLEIGAGIDQLIRHLFAVRLRRDSRYLEIGCGFGFSLDFARQAFGLDVQGIDPSPFARAGAQTLGLPISSKYLTSGTELHGGNFDFAVASEVIEHIFQPLDFVRLVRDRLTPAGVLILTTPNAAKAAPDTPSAALNSLLSVGWHYILYSSKSLKNLLHSAGFSRVEVSDRGHTLVAAATNGSMPLNLNAETDRALYRAYLDERRKATDLSLSNGLSYRLLMEHTNAADYRAALRVYADLRAKFLLHYGFDVDAPHSTWLHETQGEPLLSLSGRYPMCLCGVAHLRGIIALNADGRPDRAAEYFDLSVLHGEMLRKSVQSIGSDDAQTEVFIERSRVLRLRALAYTYPKEAAKQAATLLQVSRARPLAYPAQDEDLLEILPHLLNLGAWDAAQQMARDCAAALLGRPVSERIKVDVTRALERIATAAACL